jgi:hypothetical protein
MLRITRKSVALAALAALAASALIVPGTGSAGTKTIMVTRTVKITWVTHLAGAGGKTAGKCSGTFGKGQVTGTVIPPVSTLVCHVKGGTIKGHSSDGKFDGKTVTSHPKLTGTGKYKRLKGKATSKGHFNGANESGGITFVWTGKASW